MCDASPGFCFCFVFAFYIIFSGFRSDHTPQTLSVQGRRGNSNSQRQECVDGGEKLSFFLLGNATLRQQPRAQQLGPSWPGNLRDERSSRDDQKMSLGAQMCQMCLQVISPPPAFFTGLSWTGNRTLPRTDARTTRRTPPFSILAPTQQREAA